jgi:Peptidase_C39 like family
MMAMKFYKPTIPLNRKLELDIWREANLVESYGTSKEGLALAGARRGFDVYTLGSALRHSFVDAIDNKIPNIDYKMLELLYNDTKAKLHVIGVKNVPRELRASTLKSALRNSHVPILLTSTALFGEKEDLPHWVVLTGYGKDSWYVNNPLANSPNTRLGRWTLENNLGYKEIRCAVVVRGLKHPS